MFIRNNNSSQRLNKKIKKIIKSNMVIFFNYTSIFSCPTSVFSYHEDHEGFGRTICLQDVTSSHILWLNSPSCLSSLTTVPLKCTLSICFTVAVKDQFPLHQKALLTIIQLCQFPDIGTTELYTVYLLQLGVQEVYQFPLQSEDSTYYHPAVLVP